MNYIGRSTYVSGVVGNRFAWRAWVIFYFADKSWRKSRATRTRRQRSVSCLRRAAGHRRLGILAAVFVDRRSSTYNASLARASSRPADFVSFVHMYRLLINAAIHVRKFRFKGQLA